MRTISLILAVLISVATLTAQAEPENLALLCERFDNEAFFALWEKGGVYSIDSTDSFDWTGTLVKVSPEEVRLISPRLYNDILIPKGKSDVSFPGADFHCDY